MVNNDNNGRLGSLSNHLANGRLNDNNNSINIAKLKRNQEDEVGNIVFLT